MIDKVQEVVIKEACKEDLVEITKMVEYLMRIEQSEDIAGNTDRIVKHGIIPSFSDKKSKTFVALSNNQIVGFALAELVGGLTVSISCLVVKPDYQRYGIGKKLMEALVSYAQEKGGEILESSVFMENNKAKRFHSRLGFRLFGLIFRKEI